MSESELFDKRHLWLEQQLEVALNYLPFTLADEILVNDHFWEDFTQICNKLVNYVKQTKSFTSHILVNKWLQCFKAIIDKDMKLSHKLTDGPMKTIFSDLLNEDVVLPPWFLKTFLNFSFEHVNFDSYILIQLYNIICKCKDYNAQKSYIEIINKNFDTNSIHNIIVKKITNKELQTLFNNILEDDNNVMIRSFLNTLNNDDIPIRIFSFKAEQIKLNRLLLVKETWVDINILAGTITFECKKSDLSSDEHSQEENEEYDIITIKMSSINHLRYNGNKPPEEGHEFIVDLVEPCTGFLESSCEFLQNFRTVIFYVLENTERFNNFIFQHFTQKLEVLPETLDRSNFELFFNEEYGAASPCSTVQLSTTIDARLTSVENFNENAIGDHNQSQNAHEILESYEQDEPLFINCSGSKKQDYTSNILQTPKPCDVANISVEESPRTEDSICYDSDVALHKHLNFNSSILATPQIRSTNISVAATSQESNSTSQQDSGIDKESSQSSSKSIPRIGLSGLPTSVPETPFISVRTPEVINQFGPEVIDLISPDVLSNSLKTQNKILSEESQTNKKCSETTVQVQQELNVLPAVEPVVENLVNVEEQQADILEDNSHLVKRAQNEDDRHSQVSSTRNRRNSCQTSRVSIASSKGRKRRHSGTDPLYYPGQNVFTCWNWAESLAQDNQEVDDDEEFDDTSFFSDKEKDKESDNEFIYTRTRRIKKPVLYQSSSDNESSKRKSKLKNTQELMPPPVKRIKTIMPSRKPEDIISDQRNTTNVNNVNHLKPEDIPSCSKTNNDLIKNQKHRNDTIPSKAGKRRRMSNINNVDHLQEQPQNEILRISVPTLKNKKDLKTIQTCRQEVASTSHAGENANEVFHKSQKLIDNFDKLKYNIPSTQPKNSQKKIAFFSSSSNSSQDSPIHPVHPHINDIDHEEIFPPEQIVDEVPLVPESSSPIKNIPQAKPGSSNQNEVVFQPVLKKFNSNKNFPQPALPKANGGITQPVPGPSSSKAGEKIGVLAKKTGKKSRQTPDSDTNKKQKRVAKKSKGYESEPPAPKQGRKKKTGRNSAKENLNQSMPRTSEVAHNAPLGEISNQPNLERIPVFDLTSPIQERSCNQCGGLGIAISNEIQAIIKRLCELCIMSFTSQTRNEYCSEMEKFFKDLKEQK